MAEVPENPGSQGSPEPPPFQPVAAQYQPVPPTPMAPVQAAPAAVAPAKSGGSSALKIILWVVGILVLLVMLVVGVIGYGIWRIAHSVHVNKDNTTITVPGGGTFSANSTEKYTPEELGTDIYPGAVAGKAGNMRMSMPSGSVVSASYLTSDSKEQVVNFYKSKLGDQATSMDMGASAILSLKKSAHEQVTVTIAQESGQSEGKTQIHIMHTTDNQAK